MTDSHYDAMVSVVEFDISVRKMMDFLEVVFGIYPVVLDVVILILRIQRFRIVLKKQELVGRLKMEWQRMKSVREEV